MNDRLLIYGVALFALLFVCTKNESVAYFKVDEVKGDATKVRSGESKSVDPDMSLRARDAIVVGDNSAVTIRLDDGSSLYIGANTSIRIAGVRHNDDNKNVCAVTLDYGDMYVTKDSNDSCSVEIGSGNGVVTMRSGDAEITFVKELSQLSVSVFNDSASVLIAGSSITVPACTNQSFTSGKEGQLEPITESQLVELKQWVPAAIVDAACRKSGCIASEPVVEQRPPIWVKSPKEVCAYGFVFTDIVKAVDPERGNITYKLIKGPAGLTIGAQDGVISYIPRAPGAYEITIEAVDPDSMKISLTYTLNAIEELGVLLSVKNIIPVNQPVTISASPVRSAKIKGPFKYRFDCDGDGVFETPSKGYGDLSKISYQYSKEGNYKVRVEIMNAAGMTATTTKTITVHAPPRAVLRIAPSFGTTGS
ncbi:MAG TPA: putative Ig domain-containing protein, partial [Chitinispirillaceae bacterium]|nr:putative Ig domain-containing protein [Chitinispirillaceae bacterium]